MSLRTVSNAALLAECARRGLHTPPSPEEAQACAIIDRAAVILAKLEGGPDERVRLLREQLARVRENIEAEDYVGTCSGCFQQARCLCLEEHNKTLAEIDAVLQLTA